MISTNNQGGRTLDNNEAILRDASHWPRYPAYKDSGATWLGQIPAHWEVKRLKNIANTNTETLPETTDPDYTLQYVDIANVEEVAGARAPQEVRFGAAPSRARRIVRAGDTILSTVRTYLKAVAYFQSPPENLIVSTGFAVLRPVPGTDARFLFALVQCAQFIESVVANSVGVGYPAINPSELSCSPVWLPPLPEQRAIAAFLEREIAKLDALVAKKERLIELLREKRTALISRAVTAGLDSGVPMKDSGIPSIGLIPSRWQVERNKSLFKEVDERSVTGDEELLTVSHLTGVTSRAEKEVNMFMAESMEGYKICRPGDLVINTMWAWMGALGVSQHAGIVSPSYNVYRFRKAFVAEYVDFLYRTQQYICEITRHSKGVWSSRLRLYPQEFFDISTLAPSMREQQEIVDRIGRELRPMSALAEKLQGSIEKLREYRTALISAAVTGKIDVRGLSTDGPGATP
ncbi:MAG: restriction endonuclease subunit S [Chloroflexi bacterium]|nr:restriction endonuclease subunit S [Chloroflexota bacterium]